MLIAVVDRLLDQLRGRIEVPACIAPPGRTGRQLTNRTWPLQRGPYRLRACWVGLKAEG